eukprot:2462483-Amphidinium_carterae.1
MQYHSRPASSPATRCARGTRSLNDDDDDDDDDDDRQFCTLEPAALSHSILHVGTPHLHPRLVRPSINGEGHLHVHAVVTQRTAAIVKALPPLKV